jgi:hypothetical protein
VRQFGYLQRLYRDARSTEHKITSLVFDNFLFRASILGVYPNAPLSAILAWQKMFQMTTIFDSQNLGLETR